MARSKRLRKVVTKSEVESLVGNMDPSLKAIIGNDRGTFAVDGGIGWDPTVRERGKIDEAALYCLVLEDIPKKEIADFFGISHSYFLTMIKKHPNLDKYVKLAERVKVQRVEGAVYQSAIGEVESVTTVVCANPDLNKTTRHRGLPNVQAALKWLAVHSPEKWRDDPSRIGIQIKNVETLSSDALKELADRLARQAKSNIIDEAVNEGISIDGLNGDGVK